MIKDLNFANKYHVKIGGEFCADDKFFWHLFHSFEYCNYNEKKKKKLKKKKIARKPFK